MGDFSVRAVLSAVDHGFSSTLKTAMGSANSLKTTLTGGLGFGIMAGIGHKAFSMVSSGLTGLTKETIGTSDSMQKLQTAMRFGGTPEAEIQRIAGATGSLKTYADDTVFSLNDVLSTFGALSANGIKDADKMTEAVGNAVAVFGGGAQEFSAVGLAYSQAMAAGALHAQDWNQILNASPQLAGGLRKELSKLNPVIGKDFKGAMEDGEITAELLGQAMNNIGMTDMAKDAATSVTTFEGAMGNMEATASSGIQKLYDSFAKTKVIDAINGMNDKIGSAFDWMAEKIPGVLDKISPYWDVIKEDAGQVKEAFGEAVSAIGDSLSELTGSFGSTESVSNFSDIMGTATDAIKKFADFLTEHSDQIADLITKLPQLLLAYKGFKIVSSVAPALSLFSKGIMGLAGKGVGAIAGKLTGVSSATQTVGSASASSSGSLLQMSVAFIALGAGIALASLGLALIVNSAIQLAQAGPMAAVAVAGLVGVMALLAVGAAVLGPALTAGAVGFVAFGAAIALVGVGALAASAALSIVAGVLPTVAQYGLQGAVAIAALGAGMLAFSAGAAAAGVASTVLGAGLAVVAVGLGLVAAVVMVAAAGVLALGAGAVVLGAGLTVAGAALTVVGAALPLVGSGAIAATAGLAGMLAITAGLAAGLLVLNAPLLLLGPTFLVATAGALAFGLAMTGSAVGCTLMAAALKLVNSSMKSIASNAKSAQKSISNMKSSVSIVSDGLDALGNKAKDAVKKFTSAFSSGASTAQSAGRKMADGVKSGVESGLQPVPGVVTKSMNGFNSALSSGGSRAVSTMRGTANQIVSAANSATGRMRGVGANIGAGLANGMASSLGHIRSIAAQMASAAEQAVRAKAQIHSPSRVFSKLGAFVGEGFADGIDSMSDTVRQVSDRMVQIPDMPELAGAGGGTFSMNRTLSAEYEYSPVIYVNAEVTSVMDGREVGYGSAQYVQEKNKKTEKFKNRLQGNQ